eukprot:Sspe_Gene.48569::Locus_25413_Transcript_1_1_Confidence_1.000_Length_4431::g.48569::m.48569
MQANYQTWCKVQLQLMIPLLSRLTRSYRRCTPWSDLCTTLSLIHTMPWAPRGASKLSPARSRAASPAGCCWVLLGACGDIRNVLTTMASQLTQTCCVHFVMNDIEPAVLARDLVLLNIILVSGAKHCLAVWADRFLSEASSSVVTRVIDMLLAGDAPLSAEMNDTTQKRVHDVLRHWKDFQPTRADIAHWKLEGNTRRAAIALSLWASGVAGRHDVERYFTTGFLPTGSKMQVVFTKHPNVTLFPHGAEYELYPTCSIFRAVLRPSKQRFERSVNLLPKLSARSVCS